MLLKGLSGSSRTSTGNPFFTIIIANYNGEKYLKVCLESLLKTAYSYYEVLVIDNCSTDKSVNIVKNFAKQYTNVKLIRNKFNMGVPVSRNRAMNYAAGDVLVFLDNDTAVHKHWLTGIAQVLSADRTIGAIQCKIFDFHKRDTIQEIGMKLFPYTGFGTPLGRGQRDVGQFNYAQGIIALGAALAVRKEIAKKIGGFDRVLYHCTDDLDFSWRVWLAGFRIVVAPNSIVYHYTKVHYPHYMLYYHLSKNSIRMIIKNYEIHNIVKYLPFAILLNIFGGIYILATRGSLTGLYGVIMGILQSMIYLPDTLQERGKVQKYRCVTDDEIFDCIMLSDNIFSIIKRYFKNAKTTVDLINNR